MRAGERDAVRSPNSPRDAAHWRRLSGPCRPPRRSVPAFAPIVYGAAPAPRAPYTKSLAPSLGEIASRQQAVQADLDAVLASPQVAAAVTISAALRMRLELARLRDRHGIAPEPVQIPLSMRSDGPVILEGLAAHTSVDLDRMRLRGYAFQTLLPWEAKPPLLFRHDPAQPAGTIESLDYDSAGNLAIRARVEPPAITEMMTLPPRRVAGAPPPMGPQPLVPEKPKPKTPRPGWAAE